MRSLLKVFPDLVQPQFSTWWGQVRTVPLPSHVLAQCNDVLARVTATLTGQAELSWKHPVELYRYKEPFSRFNEVTMAVWLAVGCPCHSSKERILVWFACQGLNQVVSLVPVACVLEPAHRTSAVDLANNRRSMGSDRQKNSMHSAKKTTLVKSMFSLAR